MHGASSNSGCQATGDEWCIRGPSDRITVTSFLKPVVRHRAKPASRAAASFETNPHHVGHRLVVLTEKRTSSSAACRSEPAEDTTITAPCNNGAGKLPVAAAAVATAVLGNKKRNGCKYRTDVDALSRW